jgi:uncharacterized protein (TIGR03435 family)
VAARAAPQGETTAATGAVSSVRVNSSGASRSRAVFDESSGVYQVTNAAVRELIVAAYRVPNYLLVDTPAWADKERYDLSVRLERTTVSRESWIQVALQGALRERFGLRVRRESRDIPVYLMRVTAGRLGLPGFQPATENCDDPSVKASIASRQFDPTTRPVCGTRIMPGSLRAGGVTTVTLAALFSQILTRPVIDRTDLKEAFDVDLKWMAGRSPESDALSEAVRQQLGLQLDSAVAPVEVLAVESLQRPRTD